MNGIGCLSSGTHCQDNGCRTGYDITAGPNAFFAGFAGYRIRDDVAPLIQL